MLKEKTRKSKNKTKINKILQLIDFEMGTPKKRRRKIIKLFSL